MKKILFTLAALLCMVSASAQVKQIFLPDTMRCYDLNDQNSPWCWRRSLQTQNLIIFWEKGFGNDLSNPPSLEGKPMAINTQALYERLETFYTYFHDTLKFTLPGSKADKYKMMVMLNYSLDGTAYGGTYDDFIGALWVAPNRIQDRKMNCMAHELGHCFQLQIIADSISPAWGGSGFYEMTSQWMLWRVNPDWLTDENYHFEAFKKLTHKAYLDGENIYHSPYVIQYWAQKHGLTSIGQLYRDGQIGEDPVTTYQRTNKLTQKQFNDEMIDCYQHLVNIDLGHAWAETRPYACSFNSDMVASSKKGWFSPSEKNIPEDYGFNAIKLTNAKAGKKISAEVKGKNLRYAFVYVDINGKTHCGKPVSKGKAEMVIPAVTAESGNADKEATTYLVVMGAPAVHKMLSWEPSDPNRQYPYQVKFTGTTIKQ